MTAQVFVSSTGATFPHSPGVGRCVVATRAHVGSRGIAGAQGRADSADGGNPFLGSGFDVQQRTQKDCKREVGT